ncbi:flagellar biosynthesis protein FlhA [Sesbania bispinosa]|nr:flagellar biosynthesis protein FlhA [Sesbania bispinosa]
MSAILSPFNSLIVSFDMFSRNIRGAPYDNFIARCILVFPHAFSHVQPTIFNHAFRQTTTATIRRDEERLQYVRWYGNFGPNTINKTNSQQCPQIHSLTLLKMLESQMTISKAHQWGPPLASRPSPKMLPITSFHP